MIRRPHFPNDRYRRGLSLLELIYVLLIIGFVLGGVWLKFAAVFENVEVNKAVEQLHELVMVLRELHPSDKVTENENIDLLNLPPEMVMHFQNKSILISPWHGQVIIYPGNAAGWGGDIYDDEITLRYNDVPMDACADFVLQGAKQMQSFGLISVYISSVLAEGEQICLSMDGYCRKTVDSLDKDEITKLCHQRNRMTIMFTFSSH